MKRLSTMKKELENEGWIVYINDNDNMITLSSENGNMNAFEYIMFDHPTDLIQELHDLAKNGGYEWQCEYTGTYKLFPNN